MDEKKRKLLLIVGGGILAVLLVFLLLTLTAGSSPKHPVSITSGNALEKWFGEEKSRISSKNADKTYYFKLSSNIRMSSPAYIREGYNVVLDLNGHTISNKNNVYTQIFLVSGGASLTLKDGEIDTIGADADGGLISVREASSHLTLDNVTLTNTDDSVVKETSMGGVLAVSSPAEGQPATVTISGNTVINGSPSGMRRNGGAVSAKGNSEIRMYSGTIQNGQASASGNIYLADKAKFYMHDGVIAGGAAVGKSVTGGVGGNLDIRGQARFWLLGGSISGGTARKNGGNIFLSSFGVQNQEDSLHIFGGTVSDGSAQSGGNIYALDKDSVIYIYGGEVTSGIASTGGNISLSAGGLVLRGGKLVGLGNNMTNLSGGNVYSDHGTINMYGGTVQNSMTTGSGGNIYLADGTMNLYGGTILNGKSATQDVGAGGGNIYAGGESKLNMYGGLVTRGVSNYDQDSDSSAAGGNIMLAGQAFMQLFEGEISDSMIYGKISRGAGIYVYGQPSKSNALLHMYGGKIANGETMGTMRGMAIGAYGESYGLNPNTGRGTARIFGGIIDFTGPYSSRNKRYTLYTNRPDLECLRLYNESGLQNLNVNGTTGACPDPTHDVPVETKEATCITPGWTRYSCASCGDWYHIDSKTLGHKHLTPESITLDGNEGWLKYDCETCGVWYQDEEVAHQEKEQAVEEQQAAFKVAEPLVYPEYTFDETPTTDQLRQTAVQAMRDLLSVQWCSPEGLGYYKNGSKKYFEYPKDMTLGGVMYSGASSGLFQFLEYYDYETGSFEHPGTAEQVKNSLGSACADSLLWSWSTVCNSFSCGYYPSTMVPSNGFIPVGPYQFDQSVKSFYQLTTDKIIKGNSKEIMAQSYAQMLPADVLLSSTDDHGMMVIEAPVVTLAADGTIDTERSYVMIQDQRGGIGAGFYEVHHDGYIVYHSGRISEKFTFDALLEANYIPLTAPEFTGEKAYEAPVVTVESGEATSLEALMGLTVRSNYPLAVVNIRGTGESCDIVTLEKVLFNGQSEHGVPREYSFSESEALKGDLSKYREISIEVVTSTGKRFVPINLKLQ